MEVAQGKWTIFIDQDDWWENGALIEILKLVNESDEELDMVMFDHFFHSGRRVSNQRYRHNSSNEYTGLDFFKHEEFTWAPWGYLYRTDFLRIHRLRFEENVRFEDADFVIRCISMARKIFYAPVSLVHYTVNDDSQTALGRDDREKIAQMMMHDHRINQEYIRLKSIDTEAAAVIREHALFSFRIGTRRFIWLPYRDVLWLTRTYLKNTFSRADGKYLYFASSMPVLFSVSIAVMSPLLRAIVRGKKWFRSHIK